MRIVAAVFVSLALMSTATAELCERAGGEAYYDTVLDVTWLRDANFLKTAGIHPSGKMRYGVAETVWIPLLNNQNYLGINTWRIPKWFDQGPQHCNYNWDGGTDCGWNMDSMSSENWYNYSVNLGLKSKWASKADFDVSNEQLPWGVEFANTDPFINIQIERRYHNVGYCVDRMDLVTGEQTNYIGFHYEYGGQHCDGLGSTGFIWPVVDGDVTEGAGDMSTCGSSTIAIDVGASDPLNEIDPEVDIEVTVALLATNVADGDARDFDPGQIDPATLKFGPLETPAVSLAPVVFDADGDADDDFIYSFNVVGSGVACEDTTVDLWAETVGGDAVRGTDYITTPECVTSVCHP